MNSRLIYAIPYLAIAIWSFYDWKEYRNKDNLWFLWCSVIGFSAEIIYSCLITFNAPQSILSVAGYSNKVVDVILLTALIFFTIRYYMRKRG